MYAPGRKCQNSTNRPFPPVTSCLCVQRRWPRTPCVSQEHMPPCSGRAAFLFYSSAACDFATACRQELVLLKGLLQPSTISTLTRVPTTCELYWQYSFESSCHVPPGSMHGVALPRQSIAKNTRRNQVHATSAPISSSTPLSRPKLWHKAA